MKKKFIIIFSGAVSLAIYFFLPYDKDVLKGLSILSFIALLWLTEALPVTVTALIVPIVAVVAGIFNFKTALSNFAHPIIFLFLGGFALAAALHKHRMDEMMAGILLRAAGERTVLSYLSLFLATMFLSLWISNTATTAIMLPIAIGMLSGPEDRNYPRDAFILLGVAYSANIGGIGTLVGSPPNAITAAVLGLNFLDWLKVGIPVVIVLMPLMLASLYLILRPDLSSEIYSRLASSEGIFRDKNRVYIGLIFLVTVLLWLFSAPLSHFLGIEKDFDSLVAVFAIILLALFKTIEWKEVERFADWGVLLLFGGGLTLSAVLSETGASEFLALYVEQNLANYGPFPVLLGSIILMIFLTELASNTASAAIMVPIFLAVGKELNYPSEDTIALAVGVAASCAFMLPVATPPNALVYGTERVEQRTMVRAGFLLNMMCAVVIAVMSYLFF